MSQQSTNIGSAPTQAANVNFGNIMNQELSRLAQNQERSRLNEERARKRNLEFQDRYGINEDQYILEDTAFRDLNDVATEAVSMLRDKRWELFSALKKDPNNDILKKRMGKVDSSVKRLKASNDKIKQLGDQFISMLENDEVSGVDEERIEKMLKSVERGSIKVHMDENDNMSYLFYDENNNLQDVSSFGELMKESPTKRINLDDELGALVKEMGTDQVDKVTAGFITSSNVFGSDQERFTNDFIDSFLGVDENSLKDNDVLADLLNQATKGSSKKKINFTEQERQFVKNFLIEQVKARYDETVKLRERSRSSVTNKTEAPSKGINLAFTGDKPVRDSDGNFVFTLNKPLAIDPTRSDRKIDTIKSDQQGNIIISGEDRVKIKGVQEGDTTNDIAKKEGVPESFISKLLDSEGKVQYYKRKPFDIKAKDDPAMINKIGNMFGVEDELGLRNILYQDMVEKLGEQTANQIINEPSPITNQVTSEVENTTPLQIKAQSGAVYKLK